jgi:hypothetical protein
LIDLDLTTGEINEGTKLVEVSERIEIITDRKIKHETADNGYVHSVNYKALEKRGTDTIIPTQRDSNHEKGNLSIRSFMHDCVFISDYFVPEVTH